MLSFRPDDEDKLTKEIMEDIEKKFALALGFEAHQRVCGIHKNTANIHMHIAYNMINSENFNIREPYGDYYILAKVAREIEQEYGLIVDPGLEPNRQEPKRTNIRAQTMEARSGEQSFDSYMQERRDTLLAELNKCKNWDELHELLGSIGVFIAVKSGGCVLKDKRGKHAIKGSSLAREFSFGQLVKRFGQFNEDIQMNTQEKEHYTAKPLRGAERDELYLEYKKGIEERKEWLEELACSHKKLEYEIKTKWQKERIRIKNSVWLLRDNKISLLAEYNACEEAELVTLRKGTEHSKKTLRKKIPYTNWTNFLQYKASEGNELALQILRSKNIDTEFNVNEYSNPPQENTLYWKERISEIANNSQLLRDDKRKLISVAKMMQLQAEGLSGTEGLTHSVDMQGIIIFKLRSGGQIRDDGKKITYSTFEPAAAKVAAKYAAVRFGKCCQNGNVLTRENNRDFLMTF
jgi:hypothetical protein